jgi:hypothetical protein
MLSHALAHTILLGAAGPWAVCWALLIFSGLLGPLEPKARAQRELRDAVRSSDEPPPKPRGDRSARENRPEPSAMRLNAIELALIAELNLERARDHDAVANDAARLPEVRQAAAAAATAWRDRARLFELEAGRRSAHPMAPGESAPVMDFTYTGPERRRQMRRRETRRGDGEPVAERPDLGDRRTAPERRRHDRRRRELAVR